jgi:acyl-coenzyme A thioesterase PaaI-like protein
MKKKQPIYEYWRLLSSKPFGKTIYSILINLYVPYTGSIGSRVEQLEPGYARIRLKERRSVQNHLRSIHALAIANVAELAGNLALFAGMPGDARLIVKGFDIRYLKKARGIIWAESRTPVLDDNSEKDLEILVSIKDKSGEEVAVCTLYTLVGPVKK